MVRPSAKRWFTALGLVFAGLALGALSIWVFQSALVYHPDTSPVPLAAQAWPGAVDATLTTTDGLELGAWHRPAAPECGVTVLVAQGNGGNRAGRIALGDALADRGFGVLLFDYRGYGGNPGSPSERGLALDALAAREHLVGVAGVPADSIIYLGESLGAAVVVGLAGEYPPAAMILRSPFTSLDDAAARAALGAPVGWLLRDAYPVADGVAGLEVPAAVVYGTADTVVPADQSRRVAQALENGGSVVTEFVVQGAGHNDTNLATRAAADATAHIAREAGLGGCG